MLDRFRNLPTWLRLLVAAMPILICVPLTCILVFVYQQYSGLQVATATAEGAQTQAARQATQAAQDAAAKLTEAAGAAAASAGTSAAQESGRATGTAEALALHFQALTETSAAQLTGAAPTEVPSTETPTARPGAFATATPKTVTISLRECRGDEGTVLFGQAQPQSLHAYSILTFTVPPGTYHLRIDWLSKPQDKVDMNIDASTSQSISFGDKCQ